jgi:putative PIG3 family NAD(P)H quinone oxidoreductase
VQCLPIPRGLDPIAAAGIPETYFTVWTNVFERGRLKPGEWILIHGGSSGIGTTAIQLAHVFRSRVLATAGSREKCAACERLGADRAVNYHEVDFVEVVREVTAGNGVDVVLDMVGGDYVARNIDALAVEGRLVQIALQKGATVHLNMRPLLTKRLTITASTLRARSAAEKGAIADAVRDKVWPLLESGAVRPIIHSTFPLRSAADAHRLLESGQHIGKIVLIA